MFLELSDLARARRADGQSSGLAPRDAALLAWLALEGATTRTRLAELLWPGSDPKDARNTLRQRLFQLRQQCGNLVAGTKALRLADGIEHDLAAENGVLGSLRFADAPELDTWLLARRQRCNSALRQGLERQIQLLEDANELSEALPVAQALLRLEPLSEAAHRRVMRLHYLRGDRAAASLAFDHCEQVLKDEVGARPSAETLVLLQTIEQAHATAWVSGQPLPAAVLRPPRMIGREAELSAAGRAWPAGRVFVVTGDAGVGKSRLLDALCDARPDVLVLRARPGDEAVPLSTLVRLAQSLAERWRATLASAAYVQLLELASASSLDQPGAIRSTAALSADLLRAAQASGLTGVVLDDLQFADDASVDIWCEWLDRPALAPLRFGFASRVEGDVAQDRIERLRLRADTLVIGVPPLAARQTQSLVESLALTGTDVPAVSAALAQRIGGNPLHLLETIRRALEEHGALLADRLDTPAQVLDLLEQRLCALPADCLLLVRIAAVAASDFSPELAQAVSRRDVLELADAWSALERRGILDVRGFAHDLMLEAALRLLPQPIKRVIHQRVAETIAARGAPPARLAHHWLQADEPLQALPQLIAAARLAWRAGRGREACEAFFKAADIEVGRGQPDAAFAVLFECVEAVGRLSPVAVFDEVIARLVPLARTASHRARIVLLEANSRYLHGDQPGSDRGMADAMLLALACGDRLVEAECIYDQGCRALAEGRLRDTAQHMSACATLQRSLGLERMALATDVSKRIALRALGQVREVLEEEQRTKQALIDTGNRVDVVTLQVEQLLNQLDLGDVRSADAGAQAAWQAIRDTDLSGVELVRNALYMLRFHRCRGRWDQALAVDVEVGERLAAQGEDASELARERAGLYLDLGRPELARPHIEAFESDPAYRERASWHAIALRWQYQVASGGSVDPMRTLDDVLASERFPKVCELVLAAGQCCASRLAAPLLAPLIARCRQQGLQVYLLPLSALQAWLLARDGDLEAASARARSTQAALSGVDLGAALPASGLWLARALQCVGRQEEAATVTQRTAGWIRQRLVESVPAAFHDSFCHRNPVNRELLALEQRLRC